MTEQLADEIARKIWRTGFASISREYNYRTGKFSGKIVGYHVGYTRKGKRGRILTTQFRGEDFESAYEEVLQRYEGTKLYTIIIRVLDSYGLLS